MPPPTENKDPLDFLKSMWSSAGFSIPGMVTPTLDVDELGKRIADMKAVEGWLKMNLSTLQMTIQGLEIQRATLAALQAMGQVATEKKTGPSAAAQEEGQASDASPFSGMNFNPALCPWNFAQAPASEPPPGKKPDTAPARSRKKPGG